MIFLELILDSYGYNTAVIFRDIVPQLMIESRFLLEKCINHFQPALLETHLFCRGSVISIILRDSSIRARLLFFRTDRSGWLWCGSGHGT